MKKNQMSFLFNKPRSVFSRCKAKFKRRLKPPEESVLKNSFKVIDCLDNYAIAKSSFTPQENQIMVNSMSGIQIGVYVANAASAHYVVEEDVDWLTTYGYNRRGIGDGDHPNAIKYAIRATLDTQVFGEVLARKLGNAHELGATLQTVNFNPNNDDITGLNVLMDLQNNRIGYGYGATSINFYGLFGARTIRETFVQKAQAGEMFVWIV